MGFASPALQLADRDHWIGWALGQRRTSLHTVVNRSRFLIRSSVRCANLDSRVLAMAARQMPEDFQQRYGYRPFLLESFADSARFAGTCYQAANWIRILRQTGSLPAGQRDSQRYLGVPAGERLSRSVGVGVRCRTEPSNARFPTCSVQTEAESQCEEVGGETA